METFLSPEDTLMAGRSRNAGGRYNMETGATKQYPSTDISFITAMIPRQQNASSKLCLLYVTSKAPNLICSALSIILQF